MNRKGFEWKWLCDLIEILSQHLSWRNWGNSRKSSASRYLRRAPPEYNATKFTARRLRSVANGSNPTQTLCSVTGLRSRRDDRRIEVPFPSRAKITFRKFSVLRQSYCKMYRKLFKKFLPSEYFGVKPNTSKLRLEDIHTKMDAVQ
jgi:hypothetical protein